MFGKLVKGGIAHVSVKDDKLAFIFTEAPPKSGGAKEPRNPKPPSPSSWRAEAYL